MHERPALVDHRSRPRRFGSLFLLFFCVWFVAAPSVWASDDTHSHHTADRARRRFSPKGTKPKYARHRSYLIRHLRLALRVFPKQKRIAGSATLTIEAFSKSIKDIELDAAELQIKAITVDGKKATWHYEKQSLSVELGKSLVAGKRAKVRITYAATPRTGLHFVIPRKGEPNKHMSVFSQGEAQYNRFWFPSFDTPNMRFTSETLFTVPQGLTVISNGKLLKRTKSQDAKGNKLETWHHKIKHPHVTYLLSVVIGRFRVYKQSWKGIPILSYVRPKDYDKAARSFANTPDMMDFFSRVTGFKYPYAKYAQTTVHDFTSGGMENVSATTLTHRTLHDKGAHLTRRSDGLVAHELAHQWFGDLLTCKDWSHIWLNESFATYFQQLYYEHKFGKKMFNYWRRRSLRWYWYSSYQRPIRTRHYSYPGDMFDSHSYPKGAAVLHMIRRTLGDKLWWKGIQLYVKTHAHGLVETADLRRAFERVSGRNWEPFFDQWVHRAGHPVVHFSWRYDKKNKQIRVNLRQSQKGKAFFFDTKVKVTFAKGSKSFALHMGQKKQSMTFPVSGRPLMVEVDPMGDILMLLKSKKSAKQWLYQLAHGSSAQSKLRATARLGGFANKPKVIQALKQTILSKKELWPVRESAVKALAKLHTLSGCRFLLKEALEVEEAHVRSAVAGVLGGCPEVKPLSTLVAHMRLDESYRVRTQAVKSIGQLRHKRSFSLLVEALSQDVDYGKVRSAALWALARLEDPRALPHVKKMMGLGYSLRVRNAAMGIYASLVVLFRKRKSATHYLTLQKYLKEPHPWSRLSAINALATLGDWRAVGRMRTFAQHATTASIRNRVRKAIRRLYKQTKWKKRMRRFGRSLEQLQRKHRKLMRRLEKLEKERSKKK